MPTRPPRTPARPAQPRARTPDARVRRGVHGLGATLLAALGACGSRDATPPAPPAPPALEAPARPASVRIEGRLRDLATLRDALPPMLAAAAPTRADALVEALCGLPAALRPRFGDDAQVAFVLARTGPEAPLATALAVRLRVDPGAAPLGPDVPVGAADPATGLRWVAGAPTEGRAPLALIDDVLVCAESAPLAHDVGPYLGRALLPRVATTADAAGGAATPLRAEALPGTIADDLRRFLTANLALATLNGRQAAADLARTRADLPAVGELGDLALALKRRLMGPLDALADAGAAGITLDTRHGAAVLTITVDVPASSPFGTALAALPQVERETLARMPAGAALGAVFAADPAGPWAFGEAALADLTATAGDALPAADAARLGEAVASLGGARGRALVVAAGQAESGPFALVGGVGPGTAPDAARLQAALDVPFMRSTLGRALGCAESPGVRAARNPTTVGETRVQPLDPCAPSRGARLAPRAGQAVPQTPLHVALATREDRWALSMSRPSPRTPHAAPTSAAALAAGLAAPGSDATPSAGPDAGLAALPERVFVGLAVRPDALDTLGALLSDAEASAGRPPPDAVTAPLRVALARDARGVRLTLVAPGTALAAFAGAR